MEQDSWTLINGKWKREKALLNISNRAFRYGDGVFETMLTRGIEVLFSTQHLNRLHQSMEFFHLPIINDLTADGLQENAARLISKNKWYGGARLRLTVFRETAGKYTPEGNGTGYLLAGEPHKTKPVYPFPKCGKLLTIYNDYQKPDLPFYTHKTINALFYVMAGIYAKEQGMDDCFLLNHKREIIEAVSSNVFVIQNEQIIAPGPYQGALNGTMRLTILDLLQKKGFSVIEKGVTEAEILNADEVLLTNAVQGVNFVKGYKERRFYARIGQELSKNLNELVENA